ncbi:MAG TPA: hypothetical protein VGK32_20895, partial [Vicinamibacterales bacterium]
MTTRSKKPPAGNVDGPPTKAALTAMLGSARQAFDALATRTAGVTAEWKRYSKTTPWVLKL